MKFLSSLLFSALHLAVFTDAFSSVTPPHADAVVKTTSQPKSDGDCTPNPSFKFYNMENGMCPYAARTWMTLLELDIPFESVGVSPMKKEEWYLKINPRNKVPAIQNIEDGTLLYESAICNEYLSDWAREMENKAGRSDAATSSGLAAGENQQKFWKLMPIGASDKALLRLLNDNVDNQLSPAQFTFLMNKDPEKDDELIQALESALEILQDSLERSGGPYLMGTEFTLADVHVLPFFLRLVVSLKHYKGYEIPNSKFSLLLDWFQLCSERDSVKAVAKTEEEIITVYDMFVKSDYKFGGLNKND